VKAIKGDSKKRDFLGRMKESQIGLLEGSGVKAKDVEEFEEQLS
jgi:hypothetical protein